ncbi:MAG: response regulator transcription factor [Saprospiraceae bacterium]|nr:response regulator transcription factor [Saprospiraceae bacterium]
MKPISLAIADDQILFRKGLKLLIHSFEGIELVIEANNGIELIAAVEQNEPDVILMDLRMPEMDGLEATGKIKKLFPSIKIILLTMYDEEHLINHMMKLGANGYLLKNEEPEEVETAIRSVMEKDFYFNDYVSKALLSGLQRSKQELKSWASGVETTISRREREVLVLICREFTSSEIANELHISIRTVENHRKSLLTKTGSRNTAGLILFAVRNQLIDIRKGTG